MGASESSCKPSNPSNLVTDTVKFALLQQPLVSESPKPSRAKDEPSENPEPPKESPEEEQKRREKERRLEKERRKDERRRREEEKEKEEDRKRWEVEDAQWVEQERRKAAAKEKAEEKRRAEKAEKEAAKTKVDAWLKARGFKNLKDPKKAAFCGAAAFAFHTAIEAGDTETVRAMLLCDADPNLKNSSGRTAREVAERCSNAEVLKAFKQSK